MRQPVARGFYPFDADTLEKQVKNLLNRAPERPIKPKGLIVPHAGYSYSGKTAAHAYKTLKNMEIKNAILLGVNHGGLGSKAQISGQNWKTPLGIMEKNEKINSKLLKNKFIKEEELGHQNEHSIEVQLPFLKYVCPETKITPISMKNMDKQRIESISKEIKKVVPQSNKTVVIASSDLLHTGRRFGLVPDEDAVKYTKRKDREFLNLIKERNIEEILRFGEEYTICGYIPITILLKSMEIKEIEVLNRSTSYETSADRNNVVGYASAALY